MLLFCVMLQLFPVEEATNQKKFYDRRIWLVDLSLWLFLEKGSLIKNKISLCNKII